MEDISKKVKVTAQYDNQKITVTILDEGSGFDINRIPDPTISGHLNKEAGRGLFIVRQLVDNLEYQSTPSGSLFTLTVNK
jgi:serine/threonine-protein kinase RsbW